MTENFVLRSRIQFSRNDGPIRRWIGERLVDVGLARDLVAADQSQTLFEIREGIIPNPAGVETSTRQGRITIATSVKRRP